MKDIIIMGTASDCEEELNKLAETKTIYVNSICYNNNNTVTLLVDIL